MDTERKVLFDGFAQMPVAAGYLFAEVRSAPDARQPISFGIRWRHGRGPVEKLAAGQRVPVTTINNLLLYVGSGLLLGSAIFGVVIGLLYSLRAKVQDFRYGVFYTVFALTGSVGYCLASIAFFFNFLGPQLQIPVFCSLVTLAFLAGLVVVAIFVRKDNRVLFVILSFYSLLVVWLAPVFVWNLIYLIAIARRPRKEAGPALQTTPEGR